MPRRPSWRPLIIAFLCGGLAGVGALTALRRPVPAAPPGLAIQRKLEQRVQRFVVYEAKLDAAAAALARAIDVPVVIDQPLLADGLEWSAEWSKVTVSL